MSSTTPQPASAGPAQGERREIFSSRWAFLLAAIGSAVGLGNIWRFPYVAYDNGGGAFLIPYLVALLSAGIPLLFLDYALGHRYRGSAPLVFRRIKSWAEPVGWVQVGVSFFITIYYAAIIGWAALYAVKSFNKAWGEDPNAYFFGDFLQFDELPRSPRISSRRSPWRWLPCGSRRSSCWRSAWTRASARWRASSCRC